MKSLKKLQRKLLLRRYGLLANIFLKIVAPTETNLDTLKRWHPSLIGIKEFSDLYGKTLIYCFVFFGVMFAGMTYIFTHLSIEEMLPIAFDWVKKFQNMHPL